MDVVIVVVEMFLLNGQQADIDPQEGLGGDQGHIDHGDVGTTGNVQVFELDPRVERTPKARRCVFVVKGSVNKG